MASAFSVSAYTVDDLCDPSLIAVDRNHMNMNVTTGWPCNESDAERPVGSSHQVKFEKVYNSVSGVTYDDRVRVSGIRYFNDSYGNTSVPLVYTFMLLDENGNSTNDGEYIGVDCGYYIYRSTRRYYNLDENNKRIFIAKGYAYDSYHGMEPTPLYQYNITNSEGYWKGKISEDEEGNLHIDFEDMVMLVDTQSSLDVNYCLLYGYCSQNLYKVIDGYHIDFMKWNATLSGKVAERVRQTNKTGYFTTPVAHDPYKCYVKFTGNNKFEIVNLTENGYAVRIGSPTGEYSHLANISGGYNTRLGEAWLNGGQGAELGIQHGSSSPNMTNVHVKKLANVYRDKSVGKEYSFDDIVGAATITGDLSHRLKDTHWVTNGGTLRTYEKAMSMSLPDFGYVMARDTVYELSSGPTVVTAYEFSSCYTDNTLDVFDGDVTLDLHHNVDVFGISEDGNTMMVQTTVTPLNNTQYVDSYELWLIPTPDLVNVNGGDFAHEDGHSKGLLLSKYTPKPENEAPAKGARAASAAKPFKFFKILDMNTVPTTSLHRKDEYSFYVKANYKPETGLHPTFHNLVNYSEADDIVTGIEEVEGGVQGVSVSTESGAIIVKEVGGSASSVEVYTPAGVTVYRGTESRIEVGAGLYIVRVGSFTTKVVVP